MLLNISILIGYSLCIFLFRSVLLKLIFLAIFYPLFVLMLFKYGVPVGGILSFQSYIFSPQEINVAYYSYLIGVGFVILILWPLRKELYEYTRIHLSSGIRFMLFIGMILSTVFVLNFRFFTNRFAIEGITFITETPYMVANVLLLVSRKNRYSFSSILHILFLLTIIMLGERVASIVTVIILLIMTGEDNIKEQMDNKFLYIGIIALFILGSISGFLRNGHSDFTIDDILFQFYSQQTVCDVLYVYLCSVGYYLSHGMTLDVLYSLIFGGLIPGEYYGIGSPYFYTTFLEHNFARNCGGGLFFSEGMLAFGPIGVIVYLSFIAFFIRYFFKHRKVIHSIMFLLIMVYICRLVWYGLIYLTKSFILLFIIAFFIMYYLNRNYFKDTIIFRIR